jgi:O-antigen/teichoic acid export membrane protein
LFPPVLNALAISAASSGVSALLSFARGIAIARILSPGAFGLFGIATMTVAGLRVLGDFGFKSVLIARLSSEQVRAQKWVDTVWTLEIIRAGAVGGLVVLFAGNIAAFFDEPAARHLAYVLAFGTALAGWTNPGLYGLERRLDFSRVAIIEQSAAGVALVVTIVLGLRWRSAEALAWAVVAHSATSVLLSFILVSTRPRFGIDVEIAREALTAGSSLLVIGLLTFITTQFDNVVVGRVVGAEALGVYLIAYSLAMFPVTVVGTVISRVMLPDYANRAQVSQGDALEHWAHIMRATGWLLLAFALPMCLYGHYLVRLIYGDGWSAAGEVLGILSIAAVLRGLAQGAAPVLLALGQQAFDAKAKVLETVVFAVAVLLFVGTFGLGVTGAAWAGLICYSLAAPIRIVFLLRRAPRAASILTVGFSRMAAVAVAIGLVGSALKSGSGIDGAALAAVFLLVVCVGWFSEPFLRASLLTGSYANGRG